MKNLIYSLTKFLIAHLNESLDKVAPEMHVSTGFMFIARDFDKIFIFCANYPKGLGEIFRKWMMDNHSSELVLHVERAASGGRQDVASMAEMEIFWNRNYCFDFLDEMIRYCSKIENILAHNLMILISSVDIIAVSWIWSIMHINIVVPMRWLAACTHNMKE